MSGFIYEKYKPKIISYIKQNDHSIWRNSLMVACDSSTCKGREHAGNSGVFMPAYGRYYCFQPNCPYNKDNAPNGKSHSVVDYVCETNGYYPNSYSEKDRVLDMLVGFYPDAEDIFDKAEVKKSDFLQPIKNIDFIVPAIAKAPLQKELKAYLSKRNLDLEGLYHSYKIGYVNDPDSKHYGYLYIPMYFDDKLIFYQYRDFLNRPYKGPDKVLRWGNPPAALCNKGKSQILYNYRVDCETHFVVEGIVDVWEIEQKMQRSHINVVSSLGSELSTDQIDLLASSKAKKLYIAFDAGTYLKSVKTCQKLLSTGKEIYLVNVPWILGKKDFNEHGYENVSYVFDDAIRVTSQNLAKLKMSYTKRIIKGQMMTFMNNDLVLAA